MAVRREVSILIVTLFLSISVWSQVEDAETPVVELSEDESLLFTDVPTVSTITRISQKSTDAPSNIYVITDEEIHRMGARNIGDVLRRVPGVDVSDIDAFQSQIGVRGTNSFNSTKVLILLNGRRVGIDVFGVTFWNLLPVSIDDIERIEVHRGPGTTYGANALSGVINIITKDSHTDPGGTISGLGGTNHTWRGHGSYGFLGMDRSARVSVNRSETHAFSPDSIGRFTQVLGTAEIFSSGSTHFTLSTGWNEFGGVGDIPLGPRRTFLDGLIGFTSLQMDTELSDTSSLMLRLSYDHMDVTLPRLTDNPELSHDRISAEVQHSFELGERNQIVWGLEGEELITDQHYSLDSITYPDTVELYALYLMDRITLSDELLLYLGGRIEDHYLTGTSANPMASLVYHPTERDVFRLSYGSASRSPSFFESYADIHAPDTPGRHFDGNSKLNPEVIHSIDFGYQAFRLSNRLQLMADVFAYRINRHIELTDRLEPDGLDYIENVIDSLGNADAYGFETGLIANPTARSRLWASYSFQDVDFQKTGIGLSNPSQHKVSFGAGADFAERWSIDGWLSYTSSSEYIEEMTALGSRRNLSIGDYVLANMRLAYRIPKPDCEIEIQGFNLFDDDHAEFPGEPIGRQFLFGMTLRF